MRASHSKQLEGQEVEKSFFPDRPNLTKKQIEFLALFATCAFLPLRETCRQAGVTMTQLAKWKLQSPHFRRQMDIEHNRSQQAAGMQRKHVLQGLLEAIALARKLDQPSSMISGYKELGRMCGFYEPDRKEIVLSVEKKDFLRDIKSMTTDQLLELAHKQVDDEVIEAEFEVVE